tara:strand:+ start:1360 stop:1563 length:204 start_codon:yes stop_codon:yes gene_type:complete
MDLPFGSSSRKMLEEPLCSLLAAFCARCEALFLIRMFNWAMLLADWGEVLEDMVVEMAIIDQYNRND